MARRIDGRPTTDSEQTTRKFLRERLRRMHEQDFEQVQGIARTLAEGDDEPLETWRGHYLTTAGQLVRQLAFAGIAIVWLFRIENSDGPRVPIALIAPLYWLSFALAFDLLEYVAGAVAHDMLRRPAARPSVLGVVRNRLIRLISAYEPMRLLFLLKIGCLGLGFLQLIQFIMGSGLMQGR